MFAEVTNGVNVSGLEFSGFKGFKHIFAEFQSEITAATSGSEGTNVKNQAIKVETDKLTGLLGTFYTNWNAATVTSPVDGSNIQSDSVKT